MIGFKSIPPMVLTTDEAITYLRLDDLAAPEKALQRCIDRGLRPCMYRKERLFTVAELDRFLQQRTERYSA